MKHDELRSIAHNIADSLAYGLGIPVGVCDTDVFEEAGKNSEGFITVDFLNASTTGGPVSASLKKAVTLYREALPKLCEKHGASVSSFRGLTARYSIDSSGRRVRVTIEDHNGRRSIDEYVGLPLRHIRTADSLGRVRSKRN